MGAVTYPSEEVSSFVAERFVPWRVNWDTETAQLRKHSVNWTPTSMVSGGKGREHYRVLGFLPPEIFIVHLKLGLGKFNFETSRYEQAAVLFESIARDHPDSEAAPQAVYLHGVSLDKLGDGSALDGTRAALDSRYPGSEWAARASVW